MAITVFANVIKSPIVSINGDKTEVAIKIDKVDIGMSGFIVKEIEKEHSVILKNVVVVDFKKDTNIATLKISEFNSLKSDALPHGKWDIKIGDLVSLAFGYSRGILIAPNEEIYHKITKNTKLGWIHPDIFATILSFNGHPTPLRADFEKMSNAVSAGLILIFLNNKVFTLDAKSFKILAIADVNIEQKSVNLPFYSRVLKIEANWFGEGSNELKDYEPHYYKLMVEANPQNRILYEIIKNSDKKLVHLLNNFKINEVSK